MYVYIGTAHNELPELWRPLNIRCIDCYVNIATSE
jgi:hypothetical protein